ncbi:MAG: hypothetical protein V4659_04985 [Pseudomonadota bacterium]
MADPRTDPAPEQHPEPANEETPDPRNGAVGGTDGVTRNQDDDAQ